MSDAVKLVLMRSFNHSYAPAFRDALARLKVSAEIVETPLIELKDLSPAHVVHIESLLEPSWNGQQVLYCPGVMELYLSKADHSFHFSGYRDWHDPQLRTVLPHPWSVHGPFDRAALAWSGKPPLSAGFMGSVYADAALVRLARRLPSTVRSRLLRGRYLRHPRLTARAYAAGLPVRFTLAFPRAESLDALAAQTAEQSDFAVEVVDTGGFTGLPDAKSRYIDAMLASTYVLCPRGSENFSFRAFEALQLGRVPVIIDTDMVLPEAVPWDEVAIIVPYDRLDRLADIMRDDYITRDTAAFAKRQEAAFAVTDSLAAGRWLDAALARVVGSAVAR